MAFFFLRAAGDSNELMIGCGSTLPRSNLHSYAKTCFTYCFLRVYAALLDAPTLSSPAMSFQVFCLVTSTNPPLSLTSIYSLYRSSGCFDIVGLLVIAVPFSSLNLNSRSRKSFLSGSGSKSYCFAIEFAPFELPLPPPPPPPPPPPVLPLVPLALGGAGAGGGWLLKVACVGGNACGCWDHP